MRSKRRTGIAAMIGAGAMVLAACGGGPSGGGDSQTENLVVGTTDSVPYVDPAKCYSYFCGTIIDNVGETLFSYKAGTAEMKPKLAAEMPEISDDGTTYTIPIRKGVTFHDGSKMTAADVEFSLNRARWVAHPEGAGFLLEGIKNIDTPDDYTVEIQLKEPDITFASKLAYNVATIVSQDSYKSPDGPRPENVDPEKFINQDLVGTGPYKLAKFQEGQSITLSAFKDYWGEQPASKNVLVSFYEKSAQLLAAFKSGEVDVGFRFFTPEQRNSLQSSDDVKVVEGEGASIRYLVINPRLEPFDSVKVRKALAAGIDRERIVSEVLSGAGEPLYSMIPPFFESNVPSFKKMYGGKDPSDFIGDKKVDVTLWYSTGHYGPTEPELAQTIARSLEETGSFNVTTKSAAWAQYTADAYPGKSGQYPIFLLGWYPDYLDPDDYISPFYGCETSFLVMYCNDKMNQMIQQESTADSPDEQQRMQTFADIQQLAAEDAPLIPLYVDTPYVFGQKNVQGLKKTMGPEQIFRFYELSKSS